LNDCQVVKLVYQEKHQIHRRWLHRRRCPSRRQSYDDDQVQTVHWSIYINIYVT